ncbi:MAG: metalloregulator ArsR/SmtB family transcription factor [Myxococcota bacterium]|nr:metalloregulator ArsR/SmtB family transcription factor [Myxococcota bacterium]
MSDEQIPPSDDPKSALLSEYQAAANFLRGIGHPARLRILCVLKHGPRCVSKLNELVPVTQPNLSQHLMNLRSLGVVQCEVKGAQRCYSLSEPAFTVKLLDLLQHLGRMDEVFPEPGECPPDQAEEANDPHQS